MDVTYAIVKIYVTHNMADVRNRSDCIIKNNLRSEMKGVQEK